MSILHSILRIRYSVFIPLARIFKSSSLSNKSGDNGVSEHRFPPDRRDAGPTGIPEGVSYLVIPGQTTVCHQTTDPSRNSHTRTRPGLENWAAGSSNRSDSASAPHGSSGK